MNRSTLYPTISATIFGLVSLAHLSRVVFGWPLEIGHGNVPAWMSAVAWLAAAGLCVWGFSLARSGRRPA
jgi:hypothetical protein